MPSLEKFCDRMRYWCDEGNLGYDQIERWNIWEGGECDCSSLVIHALNEAGFDTGDAYYTGNLSANLTARGWDRLWPDISSARPGDILLSDANHVAAVVYGWGWWATIAEAWLDENGGIYYGASGDQTGLETRTRGIYDFPWDCILRYEEEEEIVIPEQKPGNPVNNAGLLYRAHVETAGWLDAVHDGQNAGTTGYGARLEAIKITPPDGWELCVKAHIANVGWKTYSCIKKGESSGEGSSANDPIIGSVGESQAIECLIVEVTKRPDGDKRKLKFKVHQADTGWHEWTDEGYASGSDGMGVQLEAIRMALV